MKGIDVSRWQGDIDWEKVKASGIDFAIIKAGGSDSGFYTDPAFSRNYSGAKAAGIPIGAYYYVGPNFLGAANGLADAERFAEILSGRQFEFPVYMDIEESALASDKAACTEAALAFGEHMESLGYYVGVYGSEYATFGEKLNDVSRFTARVANWSRESLMDYGVWQTGCTGSVEGIDGDVDTDECGIDFPSVIKSGGFNGFAATDESPEYITLSVTLEKSLYNSLTDNGEKTLEQLLTDLLR